MEIDGGATAIEVRRVDHFAFGAPSDESRAIENGTLTIVSRCPEQVLGSCRACYRLTVPDNVPIEIETSSGTVHLAGVRASVQITTGSGAIAATGFCGFSLRASSDSGGVVGQRVLGRPARAALAHRRRARRRRPPRATRSTRRATPARPHPRADDVEDAPFQIQALSTSGDVTVEAAS